ncbi:cryptochrome/photolyase family protein [Isobaculum melis]|uniref:Deoxyribodipyrimidine photo-lyase n=1 Tax=Isobaculum melis TaxID=142588 RepID=A0A1H9QSG5_9LACT|nr:deoxyribodipyrimidine photo-lyase [Isobaculum melis]SER63416.1 deoxyribodipyrimidine photo-lyase type I [Isobaculum melis]
MISVMWFRQDLRLEDNTALKKAFDDPNELILLFQVNPSQFLENSLNHQAFFQSVAHFQKEVNKPFHLQILYGDVLMCFNQLKKALPNWNTVYFNQNHCGSGHERDQMMRHFFKEKQISVVSCADHQLHAADEIKTKTNDDYKVFTPYYNQWIQRIKAAPIKVDLKKDNVIKEVLFPEDEEKFAQLIQALPNKIYYLVGNQAAHQQLELFLSQHLVDYQIARDFPIQNKTSQLSPYLRTGEISIRTIWQRLKEQPASEGKETFIKELCWRDFYNMIYAAHPQQKDQPIQEAFTFIHWENNPIDFDSWKAGKTGYPIVDAAMRQLNETGWMHNRLRMIVASFLTKDLLIDWRWGEKYFQQMLIDYEPASNIGGWQWAASTGTDAVPYFRIFNPSLQSKKFDAKGEFIRKFVPELEKLPPAFIHEPQKMTGNEQQKYGIFLGETYPNPIVNHQEARKKAIARYELSKELFQEQQKF